MDQQEQQQEIEHKNKLIQKIQKIDKIWLSKKYLENQHIKTLQDIYMARLKYLELGDKGFNDWLDTQDFYYGGLQLQLIGYILGVTRERIRQIEDGALKKLKHPKINKKFRQYIKE